MCNDAYIDNSYMQQQQEQEMQEYEYWCYEQELKFEEANKELQMLWSKHYE
jgi:hypothetical protein